ncbi:glutamyl-tRNA(Gln) amidotransferase subunit C, mitochondrial-like [Daphnia pulicaria]|jgi:aspartyl-tRNA(Asn)/glutamyl-tRNA(Gln) amidotransferase subunit C|uniref:glutamyl-tRNA(Gln) amidotransferase subunit C, mitochondrial-like n=1 Tax=Daphnia pulicaria TaxID=35523 RepID=UPI001EECEC57|nr:glutamyl-tRNA(Gln) amidotransferase subunit C, mitochondrial-like [Daphnia pulicaria]
MSVIKRASQLFLNRKYFSFVLKKFSSAVPEKPIVLEREGETASVKIDSKTIEHLERLSLVDFANREGIRRLEEAIQFANQIHSVDTSAVKPLINVLYEEYIQSLREDCVTEGNIREEILSNATVTEEEYFYAPPGNIPLPDKDCSYKN